MTGLERRTPLSPVGKKRAAQAEAAGEQVYSTFRPQRKAAESWRAQRTRHYRSARGGVRKVLFPSDARIPAKIRRLVFTRSGGSCDCCGVTLRWEAWECHHRRLRSQGGKNEAANLIALCGECHHGRVHGKPKWARDHGFIVPSFADPNVVPVWRWCSSWQQPSSLGWAGADPIEVAS